MKRIIGMLVVILLSGLSGCTTHTVHLMNDRGEMVECKGKVNEVDTCVKKYEDAGYKRAGEPAMRHAPTGGSGY